MTRFHRARRVLATFALAAVVILPSAARAETVIATLTERIGMLEGQDEQPLVQVFDSGRVLVHRPAHWKNPGDFQTRLSGAELEDLIVELLDLDLAAIDTAAIAARKALARSAAPAETLYVSDPNITELVLNLPAKAGRRAAQRELRHTGLQGDALAYPEIAELTALVRANDRLRSLASARNLEVVK
jgi:hypothetical protein